MVKDVAEWPNCRYNLYVCIIACLYDLLCAGLTTVSGEMETEQWEGREELPEYSHWPSSSGGK